MTPALLAPVASKLTAKQRCRNSVPFVYVVFGRTLHMQPSLLARATGMENQIHVGVKYATLQFRLTLLDIAELRLDINTGIVLLDHILCYLAECTHVPVSFVE